MTNLTARSSAGASIQPTTTTTAPRAHYRRLRCCDQRNRANGWRGMVSVVDVAVVEPHGQRFGGEREAG
jgi:hypothetical protein